MDGDEDERDTKAQTVADSLKRRGVQAASFDTMHHTLKEHYGRAHGIAMTDTDMWDRVVTHLQED